MGKQREVTGAGPLEKMFEKRDELVEQGHQILSANATRNGFRIVYEEKEKEEQTK